MGNRGISERSRRKVKGYEMGKRRVIERVIEERSERL